MMHNLPHTIMLSMLHYFFYLKIHFKLTNVINRIWNQIVMVPAVVAALKRSYLLLTMIYFIRTL